LSNRAQGIAAIGFCLGVLNVFAAQSLAGEWTGGKLIQEKGGREYRLYVPAVQWHAAVPLVVMLHGCAQDSAIFAESTGMNALAEKGPFLVLYPEQNRNANAARCWNWFMPAHQTRGAGEPAEIVAIVDQVARQYPVDRTRVYVAGISAGGSMTAILAACYPDVFAAAAVHSGTMYKSAASLASARRVMASGKAPDPDQLGAEAWACGGKRRLMIPAMVWHGQRDNIVNRRNGEHIVRQFARLNDWADDGRPNRSAVQEPAIEKVQVPDGYSYTVTRYGHRGRPLIEHYQVARMGHAWSGGKDDVRFSDAKGPNASQLIWNFFKQFSR
jgi:poly(hydroxyalkanoate) depolymerase family esterase